MTANELTTDILRVIERLFFGKPDHVITGIFAQNNAITLDVSEQTFRITVEEVEE